MITTLKILSYNIHKGFSVGNARFVLHAIREALRSTEADLIFLQEVVGQNETTSEAQFEYLADSLWSHFAYGRNAVYDGGHHGNAILSKFPIQSSETIDIATNRFEQRGLLHATITMPGWPDTLHALCTHLNVTPSGRSYQREQIIQRVTATVPPCSPLILAGDFNEWRSKTTHQFRQCLGLTEVHYALHGTHAQTFPSIYPMLPFDRIYCRGLIPTIATALRGQPWSHLSDHTALWAELDWYDNIV